MSELSEKAALRRITVFATALSLELCTLLAPWFSYDETFAGSRSSLSWALLYGKRCSDFAQADHAFNCRFDVVDHLSLDWELVPTFVVLRGLAFIANVILTLLLARAFGRESVGDAFEGEVQSPLQVWLRRPPLVPLALGAGLALVVDALFIASLPGSIQYHSMSLAIGAYAAVACAALAFAFDLRKRSDVICASAAALLLLLSSLWLPWKTEREALWPSDPREQSAYDWGLIARSHHWHDLVSDRSHYLEDAPSLENIATIRARDVKERGAGYACAGSGVVVAMLLLAHARRRGKNASDVSLRAPIIVTLAMFALCGAGFVLTRHARGPAVPGSGAVLACVGAVGALWAQRRHDGG